MSEQEKARLLTEKFWLYLGQWGLFFHVADIAATWLSDCSYKLEPFMAYWRRNVDLKV